MSRSLRAATGIVLLALLGASCSTPEARAPQDSARGVDVAEDLRRITTTDGDLIDAEAVVRIGDSGDLSAAWVLADVLRFVPSLSRPGTLLVGALADLTGLPIVPELPAGWVVVMNDLITRDVPAPDDYPALKARLYAELDPILGDFFADPDNSFDPRFVSWGGVLPDLRPLDDSGPCPGCIPALDHPAVTEAAGGDWYQDQMIVFGVVVGDDARAYPRHQMEIHEMVNDTLGGREVVIPYCTLCGAAQAFYADDLEGVDRVVMRTSGLLHRSNKVSYDLTTGTFFDTFAGVGVSGALAGVELTQVPVVTSTWGAWKEEHPGTTILAEDGGIGRSYDLDPLQGRDANGPIFPVGPVDDRLGPVDRVVGVVAPDGTAVAFPVSPAVAGAELAGVRLVADGSGFTAETTDGEPLVSQGAYWFAWSQFNPGTLLWAPDG
jgi:hypothetical protein